PVSPCARGDVRALHETAPPRLERGLAAGETLDDPARAHPVRRAPPALRPRLALEPLLDLLRVPLRYLFTRPAQLLRVGLEPVDEPLLCRGRRVLGRGGHLLARLVRPALERTEVRSEFLDLRGRPGHQRLGDLGALLGAIARDLLDEARGDASL